MSLWTAEQTDRLQALAAKGETYSDIGAVLKKTRGAVAGKLNRLGIRTSIRPRFNPNRKPRKPKAPKPRTARAPNVIYIRKEKPMLVQEPQGPGVAFPRKSSLSCAWPMWTDETPLADRMVCGAAAKIGRSFCEYHSRKAFTPVDPKRAAKPFIVRAA